MMDTLWLSALTYDEWNTPRKYGLCYNYTNIFRFIGMFVFIFIKASGVPKQCRSAL